MIDPLSCSLVNALIGWMLNGRMLNGRMLNELIAPIVCPLAVKLHRFSPELAAEGFWTVYSLRASASADEI